MKAPPQGNKCLGTPETDRVKNKSPPPNQKVQPEFGAANSETDRPRKHKIARTDWLGAQLTLWSLLTSTQACAFTSFTLAPWDLQPGNPRTGLFLYPHKTCFCFHLDSFLNSFLRESRARRSQTVLGQPSPQHTTSSVTYTYMDFCLFVCFTQ